MIQFINSLNPDRLRTAFNNDVAEFYTDSTAGSLYADITSTGLNVRLYPNPDGKYYFNFRPFVSALINTRNFEDTLQTNIAANNPADFIYNFTPGSYLSLAVTFTLGLANDTQETATHNLAWFAG